MTTTRLLTITCAMFLASACSGGGNKGTTTGSTAAVVGSNSSGGEASGGDSASTGTGGTSSGGSSGSTGESSAGGSSSGTTTGPAAPDFALSTALTSLMLPEGGQETLRVSIQRDAGGTPDTDALNFGLLSDAGVNGIFNPLTASGDATALTINLDDTVLAGTYPLTVIASSATNPQSSHETDLTLTVSSEMVTTLLIDNDDSENNADGGGLPSASDEFFMQALQTAGIVYNTYVIPSVAPDTFDTPVLANYSSVIWYTGANNLMTGNGCLSSPDEQFLEMWLDQGGKQVLMFSPYLVQDLDSFIFWSIPPEDQFLSLYIGAEGCGQNPQQMFDGQSFVATGFDGTAFSPPDAGEDGGETFEVVPSPIPDTAAVINPGDGGTLPLVTISADELGVGAPQNVPCSVINTKAGQAGTSTVVYVGIPVEDIQGSDAGSAQAFFMDVVQSLP